MNKADGSYLAKKKPLPVRSHCLKISKTNQNFSDLQPDSLFLTNKTAHLVIFLSHIHLSDSGFLLRLLCAIFPERQTQNLFLSCPVWSIQIPASVMGQSSQTQGPILTWCTCPAKTLPTGCRSLEGRFVAMERDGLVSKTKPAWREKKKGLGVFPLTLVSWLCKSLKKKNHSIENQHENAAHKWDIKAQQEKNTFKSK